MPQSSPEQVDLPIPGNETKVFDPFDPATNSGGSEVLDPSVVHREGRWWMYLAGQAEGFGPPELFSASLPPGAPLSPHGWTLTRGEGGKLTPLAGRDASQPWDGNGGRHCPSFVKGWDPHKRRWVERIYYAGAADHIGGPYTIGFIEWDGARWIDNSEPVFRAAEGWEHGSVYEPNLIHHDGKWKMWYVAGANRDDYLVHGYSESEDGISGWSAHTIFAPADTKLFDFCVRHRGSGFDAVFSRVWVKGSEAPPETGLWWCRAETPSSRLSDWGEPVQIMTAENRSWRSGPFKPSLAFDEKDQGSPGRNAMVFFGGMYNTSDGGPFPFAFTTGCLEIALPLPPPSSVPQSTKPGAAMLRPSL
ncbi:MAG TPA: hypothetical protein VHC72_01270 [Bryobacteraceae bacterium]|nr:hypothetical protein [Bryobacteraceae bacterium]